MRVNSLVESKRMYLIFYILFLFFRLLTSGSLVVIAPTVEDTAVYECLVSNEAGVDSRFINLTVYGEEKLLDLSKCCNHANDFFLQSLCINVTCSSSSPIHSRRTHSDGCHKAVPGGYWLYCIWRPRAHSSVEQGWRHTSERGTRLQYPAHR